MNFSIARFIKYASLTIIGIVLLLGIASSVAIALIDKQKISAALSDVVKEKTGRELAIKGDINAALGLHPTLKAENVTFSNAPGGSAKHMAEVQSLEVGLALMPLLKKQVSIHHIIIKGATLSLEEISGTPNWQMGTTGTGKQPQSKEAQAFSFSIDSIRAEDVSIALRRKGKADKIHIKHAAIAPEGVLSAGAGFDVAGAYNALAFTLKGKAAFDGAPLTGTTGLDITATLANDAKITLKGIAKDLAGKRQLEFVFNASGKNLAALNAAGVSLPPTQHYALESDIKGKGDTISFDNLALTLDGHSATGNLRYSDNGKPRIAGSLQSPKLVISAAEDTKKPESAVGNSKSSPSSFNGLNSFDADVELAIDSLTLGKQTFEKLRAHVVVQGGQLRLSPLSTTLWDGTANGSASASNAGVSTTLAIRNLTAERVFKELDITRNFSGGDFKADLSVAGKGSGKQAILSTLDGKAGFMIGKGTYKPDSALAQVATLVELLAGGKRHIEVNCLLGEFDIKDGVANARTLVLDTDRANVVGTGNINLGRNTVNLVLTPDAKAIGLANLALPVRVEGSLDNPRWYPDPAGAIKKVGNVALDITSTGADILGTVLGGGDKNKASQEKAKTTSPCGGKPTTPAEAPAQPAPAASTTPQQAPAPAPAGNTQKQNAPSLQEGVEQDIKNLKNMLKF